jgi:hypothetical protein
LPHSGEVAGWTVSSAADRGAYTLQGLYDLYDGEVPHLRTFGLQAAHQRVLHKGEQRAIIDLMRLDTTQHAKALFQERTKGLNKLSGYRELSGVKEQAVLVASGGTTMAYLRQRNYLASVSVSGTSALDRQTAATFIKLIAHKIQHYSAGR